MALQINKTFDNGVTATACYCRVDTINYNKSSNIDSELTGSVVTVAFYFNQTARNDNSMNILEKIVYLLPDFTRETRADIYTYLKTLDDFSGATDV